MVGVPVCTYVDSFRAATRIHVSVTVHNVRAQRAAGLASATSAAAASAVERSYADLAEAQAGGAGGGDAGTELAEEILRRELLESEAEDDGSRRDEAGDVVEAGTTPIQCAQTADAATKVEAPLAAFLAPTTIAGELRAYSFMTAVVFAIVAVSVSFGMGVGGALEGSG